MGDEGADVLLGQGGNDVLLGDLAAMPAADQGDDFLDGGVGTDRLYGFGGDDTLAGGAKVLHLRRGYYFRQIEDQRLAA